MNKKHHWGFRFISWWCCTRCGMLALNNPASRKAAEKACPGSDED